MVRHVHILVLSTVVVLVAAGGAKLFSQAPGPRGPGGGGPGIGGGLPLRELELTEAQREQAQQLMQQHREATRTLVERAQAARVAQRQAMDAIPFSEPAFLGPPEGGHYCTTGKRTRPNRPPYVSSKSLT